MTFQSFNITFKRISDQGRICKVGEKLFRVDILTGSLPLQGFYQLFYFFFVDKSTCLTLVHDDLVITYQVDKSVRVKRGIGNSFSNDVNRWHQLIYQHFAHTAAPLV